MRQISEFKKSQYVRDNIYYTLTQMVPEVDSETLLQIRDYIDDLMSDSYEDGKREGGMV